MGKKWLSRLGLVLAIGGSMYACRANDTVADTGGAMLPGGRAAGACAPGRQGCPCDTGAASAVCGTTAGRSGDYVTCSVGRSACEGGRWGPCVGSSLVTKSLTSATVGVGGLHTLSLTTQCPSAGPDAGCNDLCDPNQYVLTTSDAGDIDADGTVAAEAGLTLAPPCTGLACQVAGNCPTGSPTTLTGTVYDPAGIHPVYNAVVYVPWDSSSLPPFSSGAACDACGGAANIDAIAIAQTGADGKFTLANVPSTDVVPGNPIPLVVQIGKWRREVMLPSVRACQTTAVDPASSRLPRNRFDGYGGNADMPKMAIAMASDPFECVLLKMGVDPAEFQPGAGSGRIDYYVTRNGTSFETPAALVSSLTTLMGYDLVILPCESHEDDGNNQYADNVSAYANAGGRVLATHYGYTWLATPTSGVANFTNPASNKVNPYYGVAKWNLDSHRYDSTVTAVVDTMIAGQPFPKGAALATWLQNVGAATSNAQLPIDQARHDVDSVNAVATSWMHNSSAPGEPYYFSFDTPVGAGMADGGAGACGRVAYADFHVPNTALVDQSAGGTCASDADCGFTAKCNPGMAGTCGVLACTTDNNCGDVGYTCAGASPGTCVARPCTSNTDCSARSCVNGACACRVDSDCPGGGTCNAGSCSPSQCTRTWECGSVQQCSNGTPGACQKACTNDSECTQGELCVSGQCQGCHSDSDCPGGQCNGGSPSTCSASSNAFPLTCNQGPFSPQEAALEFLLLDLTSCVSPDSAPPPPRMTTPHPPPATPPVYTSATFTEDFASSCPQGARPVWRELDWQALVPDTASIDFSAQTAQTPTDGGAPNYSTAQLVLLATATVNSVPIGERALIDTGMAAGTMGAFNLATPPVMSRDNLRLTVTLHPTSDRRAAPTLVEWQVKADCLPAE
jgi:hypothetical protein